MTCEAEIHVGDIGTIFRVTLKDKACDGTVAVLDVSAASGTSDKQFIFKTPSGIKKTVDAEFTTDGHDGKLEYVIEAAEMGQEEFLNEAGEWKLQVSIVFDTVGQWKSDIGSFIVYENL